MKTIIVMAFVAMVGFAACNSNSNSKTSEANGTKASDTSTQTSTASNTAGSNDAPLNNVLSAYLQIKNALANDNGEEAANGGNAFVEAIGKVDQSSVTADQRKNLDDIADDAKEMAEHIGKNADKIAHQREHFEMLSNDVYDMVKAFKTNRTLYKDFCPMYNNGKGANWISETKDIKNPYLGKKMQTCGSIKETIQ